jgi:hypothetical protein
VAGGAGAVVVALAVTVAGPVSDGLSRPISHGAWAPSYEPLFRGDSERIHGRVKRRITGSSWRPGCPVPLRKLRLLRVSHWDFEGDVERGRLVVHRGHDRAILKVMEKLFRERFPIRRMHLVDRYGANDRRSMRHDNTSAFNCRFVAGTTRWSMHAFGKAIDVNPVENPYVTASGYVSPPAGAPYADRSRHAKGMIHRRDEVVRAFRRIGWEWGGNWSWPRDYQHFSSNGR